MSEPCISSFTYDLFVVAMAIAGAGLYLIVAGAALVLKAAHQIRLALLGVDLVDACAGDRESAHKIIQNFRFEHQLLEDAIRGHLRPAFKFARWDDLA